MKKNSKKQITAMRMSNWHLCSDSGILLLDGNVMVTGGNGSGKSTMADAIWYVLTLDDTKFNKASGENAKRTLKGYSRCEVNETKDGKAKRYKRQGPVITYLLVEMKDEFGGACVIGSYIFSPSESAELKKKHFIINNIELKDVRLFNENNISLDWKAFKNQFPTNIMSKNIQFIENENRTIARERISEWIGFPYSDAGAEKYQDMCRMLSNVMIGNADIKNVDGFINQNIMPSSILSLDLVYKKLDALQNFDAQLDVERKKLSAVEKIVRKIHEIQNLDEECKRNDAILTISRYQHFTSELEKQMQNKVKKTEEVKRIDNKIELVNERIERLISEITLLENNEKAKQIKSLNDEIKNIKKELEQLEQKHDAAMESLQKTNNFIVEHNMHGTFAVNENFLVCPEDIDKFDFYKDKVKTLRDAVTRKNIVTSDELSKKKVASEKIREEIRQMQNGIPTYDNLNQIKRINDFFANNNIEDTVKVLCDCVDFKDGCEDWGEAVETCMGKTRFNLIVKPENYQQTIDFVKDNKLHDVTIIDTTKLNEEFNVLEESICNLMVYKNIYAELYMRFRYGNLIAVETCNTLKTEQNGRYLGKDATMYGGRAYTLKNNKVKRYIGKSAREQMLKEKMNELSEIKSEIDVVEKKLKLIQKLNNIVVDTDSALTRIGEVEVQKLRVLPEELNRMIDSLNALVANEELCNIQQQIEKSKNNKIEAELERKKLGDCKTNLSNAIGSMDNEIQRIQKDLDGISIKYNNLKDTDTLLFETAIISFQKMIEQDGRKTIKSIWDKIEKEQREMEAKKIEWTTTLKDIQSEYCDFYNNLLSFNGIENASEYEREYKQLYTDKIPELQKSVNKAKEDFQIRVREDIVKHFRTCFEDAYIHIKKLNNTLKGISYGNKTYVLAKPKPSVTYETYYDLITSTAVEGFDNSNCVEHSIAKYEEFVDFLKRDSDALDYRNYFKFDVIVKIGDNVEKRLSETFALSSGGEKQVPYYILSAMALLSIWSYWDSTANIMKFVLMDEAFSNMDRSHTESVLGYFKEIGIQALIFVPDVKAELIIPFTQHQIFATNTVDGRVFKMDMSPRKFINFNKIIDVA